MGKELIFKALRHETVDQVPWVPFAGVHAGKLKGYTAEEMLQSSDKIVESLEEVVKLYMPDGIPVLFDLQIEAEILNLLLLRVNAAVILHDPLRCLRIALGQCRNRPLDRILHHRAHIDQLIVELLQLAVKRSSHLSQTSL